VQNKSYTTTKTWTGIFDLWRVLVSCFVHLAASEYECWNLHVIFAVEPSWKSQKINELRSVFVIESSLTYFCLVSIHLAYYNCNECKAEKSHTWTNTGKLWMIGIRMAVTCLHHFWCWVWKFYMLYCDWIGCTFLRIMYFEFPTLIFLKNVVYDKI